MATAEPACPGAHKPQQRLSIARIRRVKNKNKKWVNINLETTWKARQHTNWLLLLKERPEKKGRRDGIELPGK